jgi:dihydrodipicolinate synthase/N-acetylneuraminate lyase
LANGHVRPDVFAAHVAWLADKVDGLFILGSSGELASLPSTARSDVREMTLDLPDRIALYLGIGEASTLRILAELDSLQDRVDYVVAQAPYYFAATSQQALVDHFSAVADRSPRPVVLYNLPQNTGCAIAPETLRELAGHHNIVALKDSAGDMFAFSEFLRVVPPSFAVMQGREQLAAISLWLGAAGLISSLSNFVPDRLRSLATAVHDDRRLDALRMQAEISSLARVFDEGHWVAALKSVLAELGLDVGDPVPPLERCTTTQRGRIRSLLDEHAVQPIARSTVSSALRARAANADLSA